MNVNPATAKYSAEYSGQKYFFCCAPCLDKFLSHPQGYLNQPAAPNLVMLGSLSAAASQSEGQKPKAEGLKTEARGPNSDARSYVCPMCPEVREAKLGACPSCGMALEPETPLPTTRTE